MSRRGAAGVVSGLGALGVLAALLLAPGTSGTSATAGTAGAGAASVRAAAAQVDVPVATTHLVCPGGPSSAGGAGSAGRSTSLRASASGLELTTQATSSQTAGTTTSQTASTGTTASSTTLTPAPLQARSGERSATSGVLSAAPVAGAAPLVAGSVLAASASGDLRGLSAPACVAPSSDTWLVGGTLGTGRSVRLVLADPGTTPVSVDVTVLTAGGPQQPASLQSVVLAPGQQRSVLLQGAVTGAADGTPLAVRVRSSAGAVAAWLGEQVTHGLVPGGTDTVVAAAAPARHLVVPGLSAGTGQGTPVLRLAAPGTTGVLARYSVIGSSGARSPGGASVSLAPGRVVDVPLSGLDASAAAVVVDADGPVVAGLAMTTSAAATTAGDLAWSAAVPALSAPVLVALPAGAAATGLAERLVLATGASAAGVDVQLVGADGTLAAAQHVALDAGRTATIDLRAAAGARAPLGVLLTSTGDAGARAAVVLEVPGAGGSAAGDLLSVRPVDPPAAAAGHVDVTLTGAP